MQDTKKYNEFLDKLELLNKEINKRLHLKENWSNKELMQEVIEMQEQKQKLEYEMCLLEISPEKLSIHSTYKHKKTRHEAKGYVKSLDSDNWIQYERLDTWGGSLIIKY